MLIFVITDINFSSKMGCIKKTRFDYFLIWGHGQEYKDEIIDIIGSKRNIEIVHIEDYSPRNIKGLVKAIYSYDYAPFHHLKAKTKYLIDTPAKTTFIFVKNYLVQEVYKGEGFFSHLESPQITKVKEEIRELFNPRKNGVRTEDHVIHASDNESQVNYILNYLGYKKGVKKFESKNPVLQTPHHLKKYKKVEFKMISVKDLKCNLLYKKDGQVRTHPVSLSDTPHYAFLNGKKQAYENYIRSYQGEQLKDFYSKNKFKKLAENLNYKETANYIVVRKEGNCYLILDGVHRASILLHRGLKKVEVAILHN